MCADRSQKNGFTLLELLVVIAIFGLFSGLLSVSLRSATTSLKNNRNFNSDKEDLYFFKSRIRFLISQMRPLKIDGNLQFQGDVKTLIFMAPLEQRFGVRDIVRYQIGSGSQNQFRIGWRLDRTLNENEDPFRFTDVNLRNLSDVKFEFFGPERGRKNSAWQILWKNRSNLPLAINVSFSWSGKKEKILVPLLVNSVFCSNNPQEDSC